LNLAGADDLYVAQFNNLLAAGDVAGAAKVAADSPRGLLRTPQTIARFQQTPAQPGQPAPLLQYFSVLLEKGKLNAQESVELARPVIQQGRHQMVQGWIQEDKLEFSEELGDLLVSIDMNLALPVYIKANAHDKVTNCLVQRENLDKIVAYACKVGHRVDYLFMLQQLVRSNPGAACEFAKKLVVNEFGQQLVDSNAVLEIFMSVNLIREATAFLLEALQGDRKDEGLLQTKLLEINLLGGSPQVAAAIMANEMFTHYDRQYIGRLCAQVGLGARPRLIGKVLSPALEIIFLNMKITDCVIPREI